MSDPEDNDLYRDLAAALGPDLAGKLMMRLPSPSGEPLATRTEMNARFDAIDARFDGVDARSTGVDARIEGLSDRIDGVNARLDGLGARLDAQFSRLVLANIATSTGLVGTIAAVAAFLG